MTVNILIDNQAATDDSLQHEHGLSIYFEADGRRIMLDTGLTGASMSNAKTMGIDVSKIDTLILSHGHVDHTGGLESFLQQNDKATIYASRHILTWNYSSNHHGHQHSLNPNQALIQQHLHRFCLLDNNLQLSQHIHLVFNRFHIVSSPKGNKYLSLVSSQGTLSPYRAEDELSVAILEQQQLHIFASCSHNGILNIILSCQAATGVNDVATYIGGLHLLDDAESDSSLQALATDIQQRYPDMVLHTGHCTGSHAKSTLQQVLGPNCHIFYTGKVIQL